MAKGHSAQLGTYSAKIWTKQRHQTWLSQKVRGIRDRIINNKRKSYAAPKLDGLRATIDADEL